MRPLTCLFPLLAAAPAMAHPGHLIEVAGHDHWIAGGAIGAAILAGLWGALKGAKGKRAKQAAREEGDNTEESAA